MGASREGPRTHSVPELQEPVLEAAAPTAEYFKARKTIRKAKVRKGRWPMKKRYCKLPSKRLRWSANMITPILGHGIYTIPEAARLVHTSAGRLKAWFCGWPRRPGPITTSDYSEPVDSFRVISFLDLIDALVVAALREKGVPFQYLRKVQRALARDLGRPHPFSYKKLYTEGYHVFAEMAAEDKTLRFKEIVANQYAFKSILSPFLDAVQYTEQTLTAMQWRPYAGVVIDPQRRFGKPIVESAGIPTSILMAAYRANNRDLAAVADWYGVAPHDITTAVEFEEIWLAA